MMFKLSDYNSVFFDADVVPPVSWAGLIPFGNFIVELARPDCFVELGTHTGNSFVNMSKAARRLGLATRCHAVDTWQGDPHAGFYDDSVYANLNQYVRREFDGGVELHRCTFDQALNIFEDGTIDLLHIDGLHTYEAVRHDFETWLPKISSRGIVLLHDTAVTSDGFGVHRLLKELETRYPTFTLEHSNGLGCVFVGEKPSAAANGFIEYSQQYPASLRSYFKAAGEAVLARVRESETTGRSSQKARIYYSVTGSNFSEDRSSSRHVAAGAGARDMEFAVDCTRVSRVRIDPAEAPGIYTLQSVRVHSAGEWHDIGDLRSALSDVSGILLDSRPTHVRLLSLNDDPNFEISFMLAEVPLPDAPIDAVRILWDATPLGGGEGADALLAAISRSADRVFPQAFHPSNLQSREDHRRFVAALERQLAAIERLTPRSDSIPQNPPE